MTVATNMAGRGTDIKLGGDSAGLASDTLHQRGLNPAEVDSATMDAAVAEARVVTDEDHVRVVEAGGLHIIGTERHDSRRIDNQLRGRAGRQGDPGSSRFYLSLDDDLMKRFASDRVTGLMERLGLEDDVAIESRLVSKTIESAQSRVEGFNFDIRKRVVEFDDVINKQRETIYAERDKVLHNEDLTATVQEFLDDEIDTLVGSHLVGDTQDQWDYEGLAHALGAMGLTGEGLIADDLWDIGGREAVAEHVRDIADGRLAAREQEVGEADWAQVERIVLLRTIDSLWVEHLTELDDMRRGIGLRGYAQQDANEFRREAFQLYDELRGLIRHGVASSVFRVTVQKQPPPDAALSQALAAGAAALRAGAGNGAGGATGAAGQPTTTTAAAGSAILRGGGLPAAPAARNVQESLGDAPVAPASGGNGREQRFQAAPGPATRRPACASDGTTRAGAGPGRSTRSATGSDLSLTLGTSVVSPHATRGPRWSWPGNTLLAIGDWPPILCQVPADPGPPEHPRQGCGAQSRQPRSCPCAVP